MTGDRARPQAVCYNIFNIMNKYFVFAGLLLVVTVCVTYAIYVWSNNLALNRKVEYGLDRQKICYERGDLYNKENVDSKIRFTYNSNEDICVGESLEFTSVSSNYYIFDLFQGDKTLAKLTIKHISEPNKDECDSYNNLATKYFGETMVFECH